MNAKKTVLKIITDAGENGIRLDKIVDRLNAQFPNKYYSDQFIIEFLKKRNDVEQFFMPVGIRNYIAYRIRIIGPWEGFPAFYSKLATFNRAKISHVSTQPFNNIRSNYKINESIEKMG